MGAVEKVVVMVVVIVIAVILAVSLNPSEPSPGGSQAGTAGERAEVFPDGRDETRVAALDRTEKARTEKPRTEKAPAVKPERESDPVEFTRPSPSSRLERPRSQPDPETESTPDRTEGPPARTDTAPPPLFNSSVTAGLLGPAPVSIPAGWDLKTTRGLSKTYNPDLLVYECKANETFAGLARRFYGDDSRSSLLRKNNEGLRSLGAGMEILVPVRGENTAATNGSEYVVQSGESLWIISRKLYGKGSRWGEIYEANQDQLSTPDALREGQTLRIP